MVAATRKVVFMHRLGLKAYFNFCSMKNTRKIFILTLLISALGLKAQQMDQIVSFSYTNEPLGGVIMDISSNYNVPFAYSPDFIPVDYRVTVVVIEQPLEAALDELFSTTPVIYRQMGGQIVLKVDRGKPLEQLSQIPTLPKNVPQQSPIYNPVLPEEGGFASIDPNWKEDLEPIQRRKLKELPGGDSFETVDLGKYRIPPMPPENQDEFDRRMAQISLLPYLGTNAGRSADVTNNLSLNVLWGTNGGVNGFEVGTFVNSIKNDVKGVQIAGLGNAVGGKVIGTQVGGLFNSTSGTVQGVQASGIFNASGKADAIQAAGVYNLSKGDFAGVQVSGLFNVANGKAEGIQAASMFNISRHNTRTQFSGLFNVGGDVSWGQVSTLFNVGKKVDGFQIALFNVADTVSGVQIGLLNIVKKGYNRVEFAGGETLFGNLSFKLGSHAFYNIFHLGLRWDNETINSAPPAPRGDSKDQTLITWGLGYGIGTAVTLGSRTLMNVELQVTHVNEKESWTNDLNLLNQFKVLFDIRAGRRTSFFAGPTANVMVSRLVDLETNTLGSTITPYTIYEDTYDRTNVKGWIGLNAGVRF